MVGIVSTHSGAKYYICSTAQTALPLTKTQFEALTWIEVKNVGKLGEMGADTKIVSYDTLATDVTQKGKGVTNGGDIEIEVARVYDDAGQVALRAAALTHYNYAIKIEYADAPAAGYSNTIAYTCGIVTGPKRPGGSNEDFVLEKYTVAANQREVIVDPVHS